MFSPLAGFPPPPVSMAGLSADELSAMEGVERENIEARIQWLKDIQALLDGAMLLINQYNTVASQMGSARVNTSLTSTTQAAPSHWPHGQGARPKYTSPTHSNTNTTVSQSSGGQKSSISETKDKESPSEGAVGGSDEVIPKWEDPREEAHSDEMHEVRKRRLEHFSQQLSSEAKQDTGEE